jgi:hypothetical protein
MATTGSRHTEDKVDNDSSQKSNSQDSRTKAIVETTLTPHTNALCSPVVGEEGIDHGGHGDQSKETSRDLADPVAKVEETDGKTAEDDGKVQPTEKGTLVCKKDFGLDARGQSDALACVRERACRQYSRPPESCSWRGEEGGGGRRYQVLFEGAVAKTWL